MNKKYIQMLCTMTLLLVFVVSIVLLLMMQINKYQGMVNENNEINSIHTPIAYISNKVKSADSISIKEDELILYEGDYKTVLYEKDGTLYEFHALKNLDAYALGDELFKCDDISFKLNDHHLYVNFKYKEKKQEYIWNIRKE